MMMDDLTMMGNSKFLTATDELSIESTRLYHGHGHMTSFFGTIYTTVSMEEHERGGTLL